MKSRGPRTEPCGTPQVREHDWDDALDVLTEKDREKIGLRRAVSVKPNQVDSLLSRPIMLCQKLQKYQRGRDKRLVDERWQKQGSEKSFG